MPSEFNLRIARNTIILYVRLFFTLILSLYTSRILLNAIGIEDYGIYNIVGGVVVLFTFLNNSMTTSTQRYLNYHLGLNDKKETLHIFCISLQAHYTIALIVLLFVETIGLWIVYTQLNIPLEKMPAAKWVYHISAVTLFIDIVRVPYNASVIAYENMSFYALFSIIESTLKLGIAYLLLFCTNDKLIIYSLLLLLLSITSWITYRTYCRRKYATCRYHQIIDKAKFKELMSFSGWYMFGGLAMMGSKQGINIVLNIFFNVAVNAAVGIANQVRGAIMQFVNSLQTAFNPQIVKLYATQDTNNLLLLINRATKYSFLLMYMLALPIVVCCNEILNLWLVNVPEYAVVFTQLIIISAFFEAISAPLWTAIGATGFVRRYQIIVSTIILLDIPVSLVVLRLTALPSIVFLIGLLISFVAYLFRLFYIKKCIEFRTTTYLKEAILPCLYSIVLSAPITYWVHSILDSWNGFIITIIVALLSSALSIYAISLSKAERSFLVSSIKSKVSKFI